MSKHKTMEQRKEEKVNELKSKLAKENASYVHLTMQLEIAKQLNSALDEQRNILMRQTFLADQGKKDTPEYLELERRIQFLDNFINKYKYMKGQFDI